MGVARQVLGTGNSGCWAPEDACEGGDVLWAAGCILRQKPDQPQRAAASVRETHDLWWLPVKEGWRRLPGFEEAWYRVDDWKRGQEFTMKVPAFSGRCPYLSLIHI